MEKGEQELVTQEGEEVEKEVEGKEDSWGLGGMMQTGVGVGARDRRMLAWDTGG